MSVDAGIVFYPRPTTLVGAGDFPTSPLDVSAFAGVQLQVWRGEFNPTGGSPVFSLFIEESLDAKKWVLGPAIPEAVVMSSGEDLFFSYSFRLRWFRLRASITGVSMVTVWAEGLLRGGGAGLWNPRNLRSGGMPSMGPIMAGTMGVAPSAGRRFDLRRKFGKEFRADPMNPFVPLPMESRYYEDGGEDVLYIDPSSDSGQAPHGTIPGEP